MAKQVIILGAGSSKPFQAPVMQDFLWVAQRLFNANPNLRHKDSFRRVLEAQSALADVHSKAEFDINNLEAVFSAIELGKLLHRFPRQSSPNEIQRLSEDFRYVIAETLEQTVKYDYCEGRLRPNPNFRSLIQQVQKQSATIISFNYDLVADFHIEISGFRPIYGLRETEISENCSNSVMLLKLHGSLNWTAPPDNKAIQTIGFDGLSMDHSIPEFRPITKKQILMTELTSRLPKNSANPFIQPDWIPIIVPPSWNKGDYHLTIAEVWRRAAAELSQAEAIYVLGYSMPETDAFFRNLYALATVSPTLIRRFWVFNPDSSRRENFRKLLGPGARDAFQFVDGEAGKCPRAFTHVDAALQNPVAPVEQFQRDWQS